MYNLVITGNRGIGLATAQVAAQRGARVALCARTPIERLGPTEGAELTAFLGTFGDRVRYTPGVDVADRDSLVRFRDSLDGFLDPALPVHVIANAGIEVPDAKNDQDEEALRDLRRQKRINVVGTVNTRDVLAQLILRSGGFFGALSSIVGVENFAFARRTGYQGTKRAVLELVRTTNVPSASAVVEGEVHLPGRAFAVAPGAIFTEMLRGTSLLGILLAASAVQFQSPTLMVGMAALVGKKMAVTTKTNPAPLLLAIVDEHLPNESKARGLLAKGRLDGKRTMLVGARLMEEGEVVAERVTQALFGLDILVTPRVVGERVHDQLALRAIPEGGVLKVYSASRTDPILALMPSLPLVTGDALAEGLRVNFETV